MSLTNIIAMNNTRTIHRPGHQNRAPYYALAVCLPTARYPGLALPPRAVREAPLPGSSSERRLRREHDRPALALRAAQQRFNRAMPRRL
jgi:hypothetical protein